MHRRIQRGMVLLVGWALLQGGGAWATDVGGIIFTNTTWGKAGNPYVVLSNVTVQTGATLTLQPGVVVQISSNTVLGVQGTLVATGFARSPVTFTNPVGQGTAGHIALSGIAGAQSATGIFRYCRFFNNQPAGAGALVVSNADLTVTRSQVQNLSNRFITAVDTRITLSECTMRDIGTAVVATRSAGSIASNHISRLIPAADGINIDQFWTGSGDSNVYVTANVITNPVGQGADDGVDLGMALVVMDRNIVQGFGDKAIATGQGTQLTLRNNILADCGMGIAIRDSAAPALANNTIVGCTYGIRSYPNSTSNGGFGSASNLIIWSCSTSILLEGNSTLAVGYSIVGGTSVWAGASNSLADPLFVNAAARRFRLQATSPARNTGLVEPWMSGALDRSGQPRSQEGTADRGAHEFTPSGELEVVEPNGGQVYQAGDSVPVQWLAFGTNWGASVTATAYVSPDDGLSWWPMVSAMTGTPYAVATGYWNSTNPPGSEYMRVMVITSNGAADRSDAPFTLVPPPVGYFIFGPIASPQGANAPFAIQVTAHGSNGAVATAYSGTNSLQGKTGSGDLDVAVGTNAILWDFPFNNYFMTARIQALYTASEIGGPMVMDGLQLHLQQAPTQVLNFLTLRLQETTMTSYPTSTTPAWTNINWTTVYQANASITSTGLVSFLFTTPYVYSGLSNLLVDLSYSNDYFSHNTYVFSSTNGTRRTLYASADDYEGFGDPLEWVGDTPPVNIYTGFPNVHFLSSGDAGVGLTPTQLLPFVNGVWSAPVTVQGQISNIFFRTDDGQGHTGQSTAFSVVGAQPLLVSSLLANVVPPVGTNYYLLGTVVTCYLPSAAVEIPLATQFLATGWTGSGNVPPSGTGTTVSFSITTNSTINWGWLTSRVYVAVSTVGSGSVDVAGAWLGPASNFTRTVTPGPNYLFSSWSGTTNGCVMTTNQISGPVLYKRDIVATFLPGYATNGTPIWWLQTYYPATNNYDAAAMSDTDGDGMAAWKEWRSGTDPTVATSVFAVVRISLSNGLPAFIWAGVSNRTYYIRRRTNLMSGAWSTISTGLPGTNAVFQVAPGLRVEHYKIGVE